MLKNLGYGGAYHDPDLSVSVLLENPLDCGLEAATLVFSVTVRDKRKGMSHPCLNHFSFYIMDEQNHVYNTEKMLGVRPNVQAAIEEDDEPVRTPDGLILAEFRQEFLFQDLRIAFYYEPYRQLHIIELRH